MQYPKEAGSTTELGLARDNFVFFFSPLTLISE
jgi:hypothetical protein